MPNHQLNYMRHSDLEKSPDMELPSDSNDRDSQALMPSTNHYIITPARTTYNNQNGYQTPPDELQLTRINSNGNLHELSLSRRPSNVGRPSIAAPRSLLVDLLNNRMLSGSKNSLQANDDSPNDDGFVHIKADREFDFRFRNRRLGDDALTTALSAFYAKVLVVLGIAFPVTEILSKKAGATLYQVFYLYLYGVSVIFVAYMYYTYLRARALLSAINALDDNKKNEKQKKAVMRFGSFYLRVGAVAFGIGSMVYSGLEFGQFFELKGDSSCQNMLIALTPAARMILSIVQMQFIFLNTKELEMRHHKVIARFGLMHMVATNLCEWLYVLVEETKHEIVHLANKPEIGVLLRKTGSLNETTILNKMSEGATGPQIVECHRTNIMGSLVQNASPFLFPCTIEYSLICAVILFEMWKQTHGYLQEKTRKRKISSSEKGAHHFSVDCSRAHHGLLSGIMIVTLTIISLIMFCVLSEEREYRNSATLEVSITEMILYVVTSLAAFAAYIKMRDLKFSKTSSGMPLDCTLLLLAQSGVYIYCMFSIIACYFSMHEGGEFGLIAEIFSLIQTSMQTLFILNAWWRRCRSVQEHRKKPGREIITFLLVANIAMWSINALVKSRAMFRPTHLEFYGVWSWTVITHVAMPLAIFYRFHSTICLFEIWKTTYKVRHDVVTSVQ